MTDKYDALLDALNDRHTLDWRGEPCPDQMCQEAAAAIRELRAERDALLAERKRMLEGAVPIVLELERP